MAKRAHPNVRHYKKTKKQTYQSETEVRYVGPLLKRNKYTADVLRQLNKHYGISGKKYKKANGIAFDTLTRDQ